MDEDPRAALLWLHDAGHRARGARITEALAHRGVSLQALELRYDAKRPDFLADDVCKAARKLRARGCPCYVLGEGAGGIIGLLCALNQPAPIDGLICIGVCLEPEISPARRRILEVLAALASRTARRSKARSMVELMCAAKELRKSIASVSTPLLVMHGAADAVARPSGGEYLHRHAGSRDKTLLMYEGYHHDLLDGDGLEPVLDRITRWIDERVNAPSDRPQIGIEYINELP